MRFESQNLINATTLTLGPVNVNNNHWLVCVSKLSTSYASRLAYFYRNTDFLVLAPFVQIYSWVLSHTKSNPWFFRAFLFPTSPMSNYRTRRQSRRITRYGMPTRQLIPTFLIKHFRSNFTKNNQYLSFKQKLSVTQGFGSITHRHRFFSSTYQHLFRNSYLQMSHPYIRVTNRIVGIVDNVARRPFVKWRSYQNNLANLRRAAFVKTLLNLTKQVRLTPLVKKFHPSVTKYAPTKVDYEGKKRTKSYLIPRQTPYLNRKGRVFARHHGPIYRVFYYRMLNTRRRMRRVNVKAFQHRMKSAMMKYRWDSLTFLQKRLFLFTPKRFNKPRRRIFNSGKSIKSFVIRRRFFDNVVFANKLGVNKLRRNSRILELKVNSARRYHFPNRKLLAFRHFVKLFASRGMGLFFKRNPGTQSNNSNFSARETLFRTRRRVRLNPSMRKTNSSRALLKNSGLRKLTALNISTHRLIRLTKTKSFAPIVKSLAYTIRRRSFSWAQALSFVPGLSTCLVRSQQLKQLLNVKVRFTSQIRPRNILENPHQDFAGTSTRVLGRTKYWSYFNMLSLRKRVVKRSLLFVTHLPHITIFKRKVQQRSATKKLTRTKKFKKILDRRNRFPNLPWTSQRRSRRYLKRRSRRKSRLTVGDRKKFLQTYFTTFRFLKSPARLVQPSINVPSVLQTSPELNMMLPRDELPRKASSSTKWNRLLSSMRRIYRASSHSKRYSTKTPQSLLTNYFHIRKSYYSSNSVRSQPSLLYKPLVDTRVYFELRKSVNFSPLFSSLYSRFSSLQPRFFKCPMYRPTFPSNLSFFSRYNTPFIFSLCGFLFVQTNKLYTTVSKRNSWIKARIRKYQYSFFYKEDIKRFYLRKSGKLKLLSSVVSPVRFLQHSTLLQNMFQSHWHPITRLYTTPTEGTIASAVLRPQFGKDFSLLPGEEINRYNKNLKPFQVHEPHIKRIRFKPGYSRIWRRARSALNYSLGYHYRYQHALTKRLSIARRWKGHWEIKIREWSLLRLVLNSHFVYDLNTSKNLINNYLVYVNGHRTHNIHMQLHLGDFIQIPVNFRYYTLHRWLVNFHAHNQLRLTKFTQYKNNKSKYDLSKQKSSHLPDWIFWAGSRNFDIPKYLEVDFFTLSSFIIYEPWTDCDFNPLVYLEDRSRILRMYNWKYIN